MIEKAMAIGGTRTGGQHCLASMDSDLEAFRRNLTDDSFMDSDLEAFSRNLTDDSFVVLAFQRFAVNSKFSLDHE